MPNSHTSFFSDYCRLQQDGRAYESLAHRMLKEHNKIIDKAVVSNEGRIVKYIGDSVFAEFKTSESAIHSALAIQERFP